MGNFSYICKKCGTPIREHERCVLFLLDDGEVVEYQNGTYGGYGCVREKIGSNLSHDGESWTYKEWEELVDMHFSYKNNTGFAVYHEQCYNKQIPRTISKDDPNQGWGLHGKKFDIKKDILKICQIN